MRENELQAVLKAMRAAGINIVALHEHMTEEQPRILYLHYWGKGRAVDLAKGVKSTLDAQAGVRRSCHCDASLAAVCDRPRWT